jgi:hypothetical protein
MPDQTLLGGKYQGSAEVLICLYLHPNAFKSDAPPDRRIFITHAIASALQREGFVLDDDSDFIVASYLSAFSRRFLHSPPSLVNIT